MSLPTWTPAALSSELHPFGAACWRLVEAQHRISTLKLVDTLEDLDDVQNVYSNADISEEILAGR